MPAFCGRRRPVFPHSEGREEGRWATPGRWPPARAVQPSTLWLGVSRLVRKHPGAGSPKLCSQVRCLDAGHLIASVTPTILCTAHCMLMPLSLGIAWLCGLPGELQVSWCYPHWGCTTAGQPLVQPHIPNNGLEIHVFSLVCNSVNPGAPYHLPVL